MSPIEEAKIKMPMRRLLGHYGDAPANGRWKGFRCPFCQKKKASVFEVKPGVELFKCFRPACPSQTSGDGESVNEVGYVAIKENLSNSTGGPAYQQYLKIAGVQVVKDRDHHKDHESYHAMHRERDGASESTPPNSSKKPTSTTKEKGVKVNESDIEQNENPPSVLSDGQSLPEDKVVPFPGSQSTGSPSDTPKSSSLDGEPDSSSSGGSGNGGGGDGGDGGGDGEDEDGDGGTRHWRILQAFYDQLELSQEDKNELLKKRGLSPETCEEFGLRSNPKKNREVLLELAKRFSVHDLVESGLWEPVQSRDRGVDGELARPCQQFYGWGSTGRNAEGQETYGWCHPILIPYWDQHGRLIKLRPHRRGVGAPRLYVPRRAGAARSKHRLLILVEGEFKALALAEALNLNDQSEWMVASLPGITMIKYWLIAEECRDLMDRCEVVNVVVAFDNEEKSDPSLPGFKADPQRRYDAEIWARYTAQLLGRGIVTGKVAHLPKAWRDERGKADWDGALARLKAQKKNVRAEFSKVIHSATPTRQCQQMALFDSEEERIIRNRLEQLWYEPKLPSGDDKEIKKANKLRKFARMFRLNQQHRWAFEAAELAEAYSGIVGWYYTLKPCSDKALATYREEHRSAMNRDDTDVANFFQIRMEGTPVPVGDFKAKCYFVLVKLDGTRDRLVKLRNAQGEETKLVTLPSRPFTGPRDFREWLGNQGNFTWMAGERELQALQRDLNHQAAFREVYQVEAYGWHTDSKLWFSKDLAIGPNGEWVRPDDMNVFWWDGLGYVITDKAKDNQDFRQGVPDWHPDIAGVKRVGDRFEPSQERDPAALNDFFFEVMRRLIETLGAGEALLAAASVLSFATAPEILAKYYGFPGLWIHGEMRSGKSTIVDWLMEFWGFHKRGQGVSLKNSTPVGVQIALEQYSNLPVWLEEYMEAIDEKLKNVVHATTYREPPSKWDPSGTPRRIRTAVLVSGENTASRAATRSRFPHVQVALSKRREMPDGTRVNHYEWLTEHRSLFFLFGREALGRRSFFVEKCLQCLQDWNSSAEMKKIDDRPRLVHGIVYASFMAMTSLFGAYGGDADQFKAYLIKECVRESKTAAEQINANRLWETLITAFERGAFGRTTSEVKRFFKVKYSVSKHPPGVGDCEDSFSCPHCRMGEWRSYTLFLEPSGVIDTLKGYSRQMGETLPLTRQDFMAQLSDKSYWKTTPNLRHRFGTGAGTRSCWAISLDHHEMGYQPCTQADLESAIEEQKASNFDAPMPTILDIPDPRKGDLYKIVSMLERDK